MTENELKDVDDFNFTPPVGRPVMCEACGKEWALKCYRNCGCGHEPDTLRQQLSTLTQQSVDQALLVERLRGELQAELEVHQQDSDETPAGCASQEYYKERISAITNALSPSPQPTIGVKAMELVRAGLRHKREWRESCGCYICKAAAAFTESEIKMILGG